MAKVARKRIDPWHIVNRCMSYDYHRVVVIDFHCNIFRFAGNFPHFISKPSFVFSFPCFYILMQLLLLFFAGRPLTSFSAHFSNSIRLRYVWKVFIVLHCSQWIQLIVHFVHFANEWVRVRGTVCMRTVNHFFQPDPTQTFILFYSKSETFSINILQCFVAVADWTSLTIQLNFSHLSILFLSFESKF